MDQIKKFLEALKSDELDKVAGGTDIPQKNDCKFSFKHEENCWVMDGCDHSFQSYDNYYCKREYKKP